MSSMSTDFSAFALFTAGLAFLTSTVFAYTTPVGNPTGNPIYMPSLNQLVPAGQPFAITWGPTVGATVTLMLLRGPSTNAVPLYAIAENINNTGGYMWNVDRALQPDTTGYGIQLIVDTPAADQGEYQYSTQFGISNPGYSYASASSSSMSHFMSASSLSSSSMSASSMSTPSPTMPAPYSTSWPTPSSSSNSSAPAPATNSSTPTPANSSTTTTAYPQYTTEIVTSYTTYCPYATTLAVNNQTYTISSATTLTITNCPCTVTRPVSSAAMSSYVTPSSAPTAVPAGYTAASSYAYTNATYSQRTATGTGSGATPSSSIVVSNGAGKLGLTVGGALAAAVAVAAAL